jgi:hypothetical protein
MVNFIFNNSYVYDTIRRLSISALAIDSSVDSFHRCDLDSHADTSMVGRAFVMLGDPTARVTVHGYARELSLPDIPIGTAATVWICPNTGQPYLFLVHECLFMGDKLPHTLLCPNQLRSHGLMVYDTPKHCDKDSPHSIIDNINRITIPLYLHDVYSYFESRRPVGDELDTLPRIDFTSPNDWRLQKQQMADNEPSKFASAIDTMDIDDIPCPQSPRPQSPTNLEFAPMTNYITDSSVPFLPQFVTLLTHFLFFLHPPTNPS